jgi:hypothetical protein
MSKTYMEWLVEQTDSDSKRLYKILAYWVSYYEFEQRSNKKN